MTGKMNKGIQTKKIINQNRMQNNNYMYTSKYILYMKFQNFDPFSQTKIDYFIHRSSFSLFGSRTTRSYQHNQLKKRQIKIGWKIINSIHLSKYAEFFTFSPFRNKITNCHKNQLRWIFCTHKKKHIKIGEKKNKKFKYFISLFLVPFIYLKTFKCKSTY